MVRIIALCGAVAFTATAVAHHSPNLHFDRGDVAEISGTLIEVRWRNPHTTLLIETVGADGEVETWIAVDSVCHADGACEPGTRHLSGRR